MSEIEECRDQGAACTHINSKLQEVPLRRASWLGIINCSYLQLGHVYHRPLPAFYTIALHVPNFVLTMDEEQQPSSSPPSRRASDPTPLCHGAISKKVSFNEDIAMIMVTARRDIPEEERAAIWYTVSDCLLIYMYLWQEENEQSV